MTSATNAAVATAKKSKKVSHAKPDNLNLPLPVQTGPEFGMMAVSSILVLKQVRKNFDEDGIRELAEDIAERGVLQPLTVRKTNDGFALVAGERRLRAAKLAQLESVPVLIVNMTAEEHAMAQLAENIQQADLTLAEEADAVRLLHYVLGTVKAVAEKLHKSVAWVSKRLSLAKGLGGYAHALMADGITEDIELLQCVDKLDKATPGSNSAWALCVKIRAGKAGREDAREALRNATEPKITADKNLAEKVAPDPLWQSHAFRHWLKSDYPWHPPVLLPVLWNIIGHMGDESTEFLEGRYNAESARLTAINEELKKLEEEHMETLKQAVKAVTEKYGDLALHEFWVKHVAEGGAE